MARFPGLQLLRVLLVFKNALTSTHFPSSAGCENAFVCRAHANVCFCRIGNLEPEKFEAQKNLFVCRSCEVPRQTSSWTKVQCAFLFWLYPVCSTESGVSLIARVA